MGGPVLGGGVIVLVAVLLWLVYLLPSWHQRRQYDAAERNAVRLNQALRILAETSETPGEVRLELNARTAMAQQRLARQAIAEREQVALEEARVDLERARRERAAAEVAARDTIRADRAEAHAAEERARTAARAAEARARAEAAADRARPEARRARARRGMRVVALVLGAAGLAAGGWGAWQIVSVGSALWAWVGGAAAVVSLLTLQRLSRVASRAVARPAAQTARTAQADMQSDLQDVALDAAPRRQWAPRELPRPLTASAGSRAAAVLDAEAAREALRQAAVEQVMRDRAEARRPPSIDTARTARPAASAEFSRMGVVDDAEIEAHVRRLLERRAVGQ
ncbi:large exoprotein [Microbacterium sp. CJ88]|uniref:large exoprotein n=1 Tax=Microbacterium sp. CJ88 TaxID=3445672 RepID=UPI003F65EF49